MLAPSECLYSFLDLGRMESRVNFGVKEGGTQRFKSWQNRGSNDRDLTNFANNDAFICWSLKREELKHLKRNEKSVSSLMCHVKDEDGSVTSDLKNRQLQWYSTAAPALHAFTEIYK